MDTINNNPTLRNLLVGLFAILIAFVAIKSVSEIKAMKVIGKSVSMPNVISVAGKGEVIAKPDIATFSFSVTEEAESVTVAQAESAKKTDAILAHLKSKGISDADIKTIAYNIYPRYDYVGGTMYTSGKQVLGAYVVSQTIEVKVKKIEEAGSLLSGIGEFGATNVSGLTFSVDKYDDLLRQAREKAIEDAKEQADILAKSLGVTIVGITSFYDQAPYTPYPMMYAKESAMGMGGDAVQNISLPAGENKIISNVMITYEIK